MLWMLFMLLAVFLWAWSNILDKVLRTRYLKDSVALMAAFGIYSIIFSFVLFLFIGIPHISFWNLLAALTAGFILAYALIPYLKALSIEEASRVIPLWHLAPIFTLVLAVIFLKEILTKIDYAAFTIILLGGVLISTRRIGSVFKLSPAVPLMLLSSLLLAFSDVLLKFSYSEQVFWPTFLVFQFGVSLGSLSFFMIPSARRNVSKAFLTHRYVFGGILLISTSLGWGGQIMFNNAVFRGPITLISVFVGFQSLFVLVIATILSLKFPLFIKEAIDIKTIGIKLVAIVMMAFGLFLLVS